jgi:competence/damage-inducible protein CinA-like protein
MAKDWSAEIVAIGSELLLGQIIDTNTSYLAARFQELGIEVRFSSQVGDDPGRMAEVLSRALKRSRIIITTGGIGPTEDDLTREVIARITGRKLVFHPKLLRIIRGYFDLAGFVMAPNNRKQAYIPAGAQTLLNPIGTAPGFILETENGHLIITVPGVPRELKRMWTAAIAPFLQKKMGAARGLIEYKVLKVCGLGESRVDEQIGDLIRESTNPVIGLLASPGEIRIRLTATGKNREATQNLIQTAADQIRERLGPVIFGEDEDTLEGTVARELEQQGLTLAVADAFSGGRIFQRLQAIRSPRVKGGWVIQQLADWPLNLKKAKKKPGLSLARSIRKALSVDCGLGIFVAENAGRQVLHLGFIRGSRLENYEHPIGGPPDILADRVTVMALDWLRKMLLRS